ncbi:DPY30 domain containing 2 isoform X2 [Pristis pectinata]|uniref:DPY30 domain containing 2 isoform X2 n=1 Tax=Pristis pectinata TaxID=685728 RepID=UPI00223DBA27|nr:DPY30 domain containing 2 isoform X2 [Pristis pectinata]
MRGPSHHRRPLLVPRLPHPHPRQYQADEEELDAEMEIYLKEKAVQEQLNAELEEIQQVYQSRLLMERTAASPDERPLSATSAPVETIAVEMLAASSRSSPTSDTQVRENLSSLAPPEWLGEPELETVKEEDVKQSKEPSEGSGSEPEPEQDAAEEMGGPAGQ